MSSAMISAAPPLLVIGGATATGKTGLSLRVADALRADGVPVEIISADSRQVYRGMDVGTAKVSTAERARIPHHGLDLVDPDEPFSVADFAAHADTALAGIARRQGVAILVGGTGLYLRAVARGVAFDVLPSDAGLRTRLEADLASAGLGAAVDRLRATGPRLARRTDLRNPRRVVRALEIALLAGDVELPEPRGYAGPCAWLGISVEPETHRRWIAERARAQFEGGLIDEARRLRERHASTLPAFSAIGYREAWAVLDGECSVLGAIELDARRNVAFARRQRTWFRSEPGIEWLVAGEAEDPFPEALTVARRLMRAGAAERADAVDATTDPVAVP